MAPRTMDRRGMVPDDRRAENLRKYKAFGTLNRYRGEEVKLKRGGSQKRS